MKTSEMKVLSVAVSGLSALGRHVKRQGRSVEKAVESAKSVKPLLRRMARLEKALDRLKGKSKRGRKARKAKVRKPKVRRAKRAAKPEAAAAT